MVVDTGFLKEVEIRNIRAVSYMKIPLSRINLVVGRNNTGKTTVLEALALLLTSLNNYRDFLGNNVLDAINTHRGGLEHLVRKGESRGYVAGELSDGTRIEIYVFRNTGEVEAEKWGEVLDALGDLGSLKHDTPVVVSIVNGEVANVIIYGKREVVMRRHGAEPVYVHLYSAKQVDLVKTLLEKTEASRIRELVPHLHGYRNSFFVFKYGEHYEEVPVNAVGDGVLALLELTLPVVAGARYSIVDNPEAHMHPSTITKYVEKILDTAEKNEAQHTVSTQSRDIAEELVKTAHEKNLLNHVEVIRIYRLPNGEVDYETLTGTEAHEELEQGDLRGI